MQQYIEDRPEKELLAYVQVETANWLKPIVPEETDKYVMLASLAYLVQRKSSSILGALDRLIFRSKIPAVRSEVK